MLIGFCNHRNVGMPHQDTEAERVDVVFETFGGKRVSDAIGNKTLKPEFCFEPMQTTLDGILCPRVASPVSEYRSWVSIRDFQLALNNLISPFGQEDDPMAFLCFVHRSRQDDHAFFQINMVRFNGPGFSWATSCFPHEFEEITKDVVTYVIKDFLQLRRRVIDFAASAGWFVFDVGDGRPVNVTLFNGPVESSLNDRNCVILGVGAPSWMQVHPLRDVFWLQLSNSKTLADAFNKRFAVKKIVVVSAFRAPFLAPIKIDIEQLSHGRLVVIQVDIIGHQFMVFGPRFFFVSSQIDLAFANLDVPAFGLFAEKRFGLSHCEPFRKTVLENTSRTEKVRTELTGWCPVSS